MAKCALHLVVAAAILFSASGGMASNVLEDISGPFEPVMTLVNSSSYGLLYNATIQVGRFVARLVLLQRKLSRPENILASCEFKQRHYYQRHSRYKTKVCFQFNVDSYDFVLFPSLQAPIDLNDRRRRRRRRRGIPLFLNITATAHSFNPTNMCVCELASPTLLFFRSTRRGQ